MSTIKDLSKHTGLSVGTISRYLNGEQLKPKNQELIEQGIIELNYERNLIARSMKTGKTMTIAVIVPYLANMFSMRVIESIERELQKSNYCVLVSDCRGNLVQEINRIEMMKGRQVDGFVLMPSGNKVDTIKKAVGNIPLILVDRILDKPIFDSVIINNELKTYEHVVSLLKSGIRKIGIIKGPDNISTARQRRIGYEKALAEYNIKNEFEYLSKDFSVEEGYKGMKVLEKYNLEAIFASNYELSVGAVNANDNNNLKILGFDTFDIPVRYYDNYTGIAQPIEEIGRLAAIVLLDRIHNPQKEIENIVI